MCSPVNRAALKHLSRTSRYHRLQLFGKSIEVPGANSAICLSIVLIVMRPIAHSVKSISCFRNVAEGTVQNMTVTYSVRTRGYA
jgi:hypothetical protein